MHIKGLRPGPALKMFRQQCFGVKPRPRHVFFCIADHYEPDWGGASDSKRLERVDRWYREYPESVHGISDSLGRCPRHTFFFPAEEYREGVLDRLAELCHRGFGEVEVHLHHDNDTSENLREQMVWFKETLYHRHGLLRRDETGEIRYGFIHGNWALDNSLPNGCWCGVNDEISVLRETGCYADFTLPAAPSPAQTTTINSIYYATDDRDRPKSHDTGQHVEVGVTHPIEPLLMIQGPLGWDFGNRKYGLFPRLENGDLHANRPPEPRRIPLWLNAGISVRGCPEWRFVKLHTHGAKEANADVLLGKPMRDFHEALEIYSRRHGFQYYYVTAWEMAQLVKAAERGERDPAAVLKQARNAVVCK